MRRDPEGANHVGEGLAHLVAAHLFRFFEEFRVPVHKEDLFFPVHHGFLQRVLSKEESKG